MTGLQYVCSLFICLGDSEEEERGFEIIDRLMWMYVILHCSTLKRGKNKQLFLISKEYLRMEIIEHDLNMLFLAWKEDSSKLLLDEKSPKMRELPRTSEAQDYKLHHRPSYHSRIGRLRLISEFGFPFLNNVMSWIRQI